MLLEKRIYNDYIVAFKTRDAFLKNILGFLLAEIKNKKIGLKKEELDDKETLGVIKKQKKKLEETLQLIGGREAEKNKVQKEIEILSAYLPRQLSRDETAKIVDSVIKGIGAGSMKDMGRVMKSVLAEYADRMDSSLLSKIVKERLSV